MSNRLAGHATNDHERRLGTLESLLGGGAVNSVNGETGVLSIVGGTDVSVSTGGGVITVTNDAPASSVTLSASGGGETLVDVGTGPALVTKSLVAGTGMTLAGAPTELTITNASPATSVALSSAGGTETLVQDGAGPALATKGLTAGTGISLVGGANEVTITNSAPASSVSLSSAGGTETLVQDGVGPTLATKGLVAGTGISLVGGANDVTITNASPATGVTLTSAGGTNTLVVDGTGPTLSAKGLTAGTGITLTPGANDITIAAAGGAAVTSVSDDGTLTVSPTTGAVVVSLNTTGTVYVHDLADFPAPVGTVITLAPFTTYIVHGTVNLGLNRIFFQTASLLRGGNAYRDAIVSTITSNAEYVLNYTAGAASIVVTDLTISGPGASGNIANFVVGAGFACHLSRCRFLSSGLIEFGDATEIRVFDCLFSRDGTQAKDCMQLKSTATITQIHVHRCCFMNLNTMAGLESVAGSSTAHIRMTACTFLSPNGVALADKGTTVRGDYHDNWVALGVVHFDGVDQTPETIGWFYDHNNGIADHHPQGQLHVSTPAVTVIPAANTPVKMAGTTTSGVLNKMSMPLNNRITYLGVDDMRALCIANVGVDGAANNNFINIYIAVNGVVQPISRTQMQTDGGADPGHATSYLLTTLSINDFVEIWAENTSGAANVTAVTLQLVVAAQ